MTWQATRLPRPRLHWLQHLAREPAGGEPARGEPARGDLSGACLVDADFTDATFANNTNLYNAIFCRTIMPNGQPNNSGCALGTPCCPICTSDAQCGANQRCVDGACRACDVCASGCAQSTVQAAITAASAGATIVICPGTYATSATIAKNLTLLGAGMGADPSTDTILDGDQTATVLSVTGGVTVTVRALTVTRGKAANVGAASLAKAHSIWNGCW